MKTSPRLVVFICEISTPEPANVNSTSLPYFSVNRRKNVLKIGAVDILNGTPIIDIKPYVYKFDHRDEVTVKNGWVEDKHLDDIFNWNATPKGLRDKERTHK